MSDSINKEFIFTNDNDDKMYLNLLKCNNDKFKYEIAFLDESEIQNDKEHHWFDCAEIMSFTDRSNIMKYLLMNNLTNTSIYSKSNCQFAMDTLCGFYDLTQEIKLFFIK